MQAQGQKSKTQVEVPKKTEVAAKKEVEQVQVKQERKSQLDEV